MMFSRMRSSRLIKQVLYRTLDIGRAVQWWAITAAGVGLAWWV
jgi:hypothetical protein